MFSSYPRQSEPWLLILFFFKYSSAEQVLCVQQQEFCQSQIKGKCPAASHLQIFVGYKNNQKMPNVLQSSDLSCLLHVVISGQNGPSTSQLIADVWCTTTNTDSAASERILLLSFQERPTGDTKSADGNIQTEETALLNHSAQQPPEPTPGSSTSTRTWRQTFACPPQGFLALAVTNGM